MAVCLSGHETVEFYPNEHFVNSQDGREQERVTDSCFGIRGKHLKKYHVECQSTQDDTMLLRMFEYDAQIALDAGEIRDGILTVRFPNSAVLCLRCRASTPDVMTIRIEFPEGSVAGYSIPVMKAQKYSLDDLFAKRLLFLIPFHIFSYENRFAEYEKDENLLRTLMTEYERIKERLEALNESGSLTEYAKRTIEEMSGKVVEHIAKGYDRVREGVRAVMGGKVLEYEAKTILNEGIALGRNEGIVLGRNEGIVLGRNEGIASIARRMLSLRFTLEQIVQATGLSLDEVRSLKDGRP